MERPLFESAGYCNIRSEYRALAESFTGLRVVLYQGRRRGSESSPGYFGTAVIENVYDRPDRGRRCVVALSAYEAFDMPRPLQAGSGMLEAGLVSPSGRLKGWRAAEDIREISYDDYRRILGDDDTVQHPFDFRAAAAEPLAEPKFREQSTVVRDPAFAREVYRAYRGLCAISRVRLLGGYAGTCGLVAAHIYPHALLPLNSVNSGILLAPSWHARYDTGQILIHDDYSWSAVVEDADTLAITDRRLMLPVSTRDWPDVDLIGRNRVRLRQLLGQK